MVLLAVVCASKDVFSCYSYVEKKDNVYTENMKNVGKTSVREKGVYAILAHHVHCAKRANHRRPEVSSYKRGVSNGRL